MWSHPLRGGYDLGLPEPRVKRTLNEDQLTERRDILGSLIHDKGEIEQKKDSQVKKWNEQLKLIDEQIHTIGIEIYEKSAWIPAQMALGEERAEKMPPGVSGRAAKKSRGKKTTAKKKTRASNASNGSTDLPPEAA